MTSSAAAAPARGKTLAFSLPLVARLAASTSKRQPKRPRALILVPTRELANQVLAVVDPLARALGMRTTSSSAASARTRRCRRWPPASTSLIACPGRLEDLIQQGHADLGAVEITILDEADHMADLGFLPGVKRLLDRTPKVGQRMLFSATLDNGVDVLVKRYLTNPTTHSVDPAVAPVSDHDPPRLPGRRRRQGPRSSRSSPRGLGRTVLFTRTKHQAKKLAKQLTAAGVPAVDLHGNLSQNARERNLEAFTDGSTRVLCATDIAARGIHVDDVAIVVHVDPPAEHKAYLHRSGRTARAGAGGTVVTIATPDQAGEVRTLARQAGITPEVSAIKPGARRDHRADRSGRALRRAGARSSAAAAGQAAAHGGRRGGGRGRGSPAAPRRRRAAAPAAPPSPAVPAARPARRAPAPSSPPGRSPAASSAAVPAGGAPAPAAAADPRRRRLTDVATGMGRSWHCPSPPRDRARASPPARSSSTPASASAAPTSRPPPGCTASRRAPTPSWQVVPPAFARRCPPPRSSSARRC